MHFRTIAKAGWNQAQSTHCGKLNNYVQSGSHYAAQASPKCILTPPQPPEKLGLQVHATVPSLVFI